MKIAKAILQKAVTEKPRYILITVIDADILGLSEKDSPQIIQTALVINGPNIYAGLNPSIQINKESYQDREDLIGLGISGIITQEQWACVDLGKSYLEQISEL